MAILDSIPDTKSFQVTYQLSNGLGSSKVQKLVALNPDGTVYDCTNLISVSLVVASPVLGNPGGQSTYGLTLGTHDATGVETSIDNGTATAIIGSLNVVSPQISIFGQTASDKILLDVGSLALNVRN